MKTPYYYDISEHINLNITEWAQKVIESDKVIFGAEQKKPLSFGTIVNTIISSYDDDFPLVESLIKKKDYQSYRKIRLTNASIEALSFDENSFPFVKKYTVTQFIKCLLESYARISFLEREKLILKKNTIEPIETAITKSKNIKFNYSGEIVETAPYKIVASKEGSFQYLIGKTNGKWESYRISRIRFLSAKGKFTPFEKIELDYIDKALSEYGPTFCCEPVAEIKVRFTPNGLTRYNYSVIHRPIHKEIISYANDEPIYVFECSEKQALYFFFSYANDVEILEPLSLRQKFIDMFRSGLECYNKNKPT